MILSVLAKVVAVLLSLSLMCAVASAAGETNTPSVFAEFNTWMQQYLTATNANQRATLESPGAALALKRRAAMKELIQSNPRRALELAVPESKRQQLPAAITQQLEKHLRGRGDLLVLIADDFARGKSETHYTATLDGQTYRAFVFGKLANGASHRDMLIEGIVIEDLMAVREAPQPKS